jgi:hypothetical protein
MKYLSCLVLVLSASFLLTACNKKKETLNLELTIRDFHTGEPIAAGVELSYQENPVQGSAVSTMWLGTAGADGKFSYKSRIGKKYKLQLSIHGGEEYTHVMSLAYGFGSAYQETSLGGKHSYTIELKRQYRYLLRLESVNCVDATDSVWVSSDQEYSATYLRTGCIDEDIHFNTFGGPQPYSYSDSNPNQVFHVKVKRNGVVTEFDQSAVLQPGVITPVDIQY